MKKLLALVLVALFALPGAAADGARDAPVIGRLDPEFGKRGQVLLPRGTVEGSESALLRDGRVVVAERAKMLALLPSGDIDKGFGEAGFAALSVPPGSSAPEIVAVLVDSQDRLVVVGSCTFPSGETSQEAILAERFTADGRIDRSFAGGKGFAVTRFDDPARGKPRSIDSVVAAALDDAGRILVSGETSGGQITYKGFPYGAPEPFVARLASDGVGDSSFGEDGLASMPGTTHVGKPVLDSTGGIYVATSQALFHLRADGNLDPAFGESGVRQHVRFAYELAAVDGLDRPLFYGQLATGGVIDRILIKRLLPNGVLDHSFGQNGAVSLRLPRLHDVELGLDERGGVWVAATQKRRRQQGRQRALEPAMVMTRLRSSDGLDAPFRRGGLLRIPFDRGQRVEIDGVEVVDNEILLSGKWCEPGPCGRAFVRAGLGSP